MSQNTPPNRTGCHFKICFGKLRSLQTILLLFFLFCSGFFDSTVIKTVIWYIGRLEYFLRFFCSFSFFIQSFSRKSVQPKFSPNFPKYIWCIKKISLPDCEEPRLEYANFLFLLKICLKYRKIRITKYMFSIFVKLKERDNSTIEKKLVHPENMWKLILSKGKLKFSDMNPQKISPECTHFTVGKFIREIGVSRKKPPYFPAKCVRHRENFNARLWGTSNRSTFSFYRKFFEKPLYLRKI